MGKGGGGGGDSHMKQTVNFGFWSGQSANILSRQGLVRVPRRNTEYRSQIFFLTCFVYRVTSVIINNRGLY